MANTSTRPVIASLTGLVTYNDPLGNAYPALVVNDYAIPGGSTNAGVIDLAYVDPNPGDTVQPADFITQHHGRNVVFARSVPDQGNVGGTTVNTATTAPIASNCTLTNSSTSVTVTGSTTGIPAAGTASGAGITPGTTYTLSGTTVTLSAATSNSSAGTNVAVTFTTFAATVSSATGVPAAGYVYGPGVPDGTAYTLSGTTVTLAAAATATQSAAPLTYSATLLSLPNGYWNYPTVYVP